MRLGILYRLPVLAHLAVWADDNGRADRPFDLLAVHHLLAPSAVGAHGVRVRVGEQRESERVAVAEFLVRLDAVLADAQDNSAALLRFSVQVSEAASLFGAADRKSTRLNSS